MVGVMRTVTLAQRLRYAFDRTLSRGPSGLLMWLGLASALVIAAVAVLVRFAGVAPQDEVGNPPGFWKVMWMSFMRALDAGTVAGDTGSWSFLLSMLAVSLAGIFILSTLIGVLTSGIEAKLDDLRKGRSLVIEDGHTVILGWSEHVFTLVSELVVANANRRRSAIAILADKDKVEMEDQLRAKVGPTGRTRVLCRTGSPIDLSDLDVVNPQGARSIVIVAPEGPNADTQVIKTILALTNGPNRRREPYHIVAEVRDARNLEVARMVGGEEAQLVVVSELVSRIAVQTCRQPGLSVIYTELLDFGGDEIYFHEETRLVGRTFGDALLAYEDSSIIGIQSKGVARVNPPMDTRIGAGDRVIAISADDDTVRLAEHLPEANESAIREATPRPATPERTLILGWNHRAPFVMRELDAYVAPGSEVTVATDDGDAQAAIDAQRPVLTNLTATFAHADPDDRRALDALDVPRFDHVITLSSCDRLEVQEADARTLVTLLHLRDIARRAGVDLSIVSEMLDVKNRDLAAVAQADDFIVSDRLIALFMAQLSENAALKSVLDDLFDPEGSELYLKPAADYVEPGTAVTFATVVLAAQRRGEVAIGYRKAAQEGDPKFGVRVNPPKSEPVAFCGADSIVVLAER